MTFHFQHLLVWNQKSRTILAVFFTIEGFYCIKYLIVLHAHFHYDAVGSATVLGRNRKWATYNHAKLCIGVIVVAVIISCIPLYLSYHVTR